MRCGQDWQPTVIKRVIDRYASSTEVVQVATDAGNAYLKGMGNGQGNETLACELVGSELAALIGLTVPSFAVVDLQDLEIETISGRRLAMGPAFLSQAQDKVITGDADGSCLRRLRNRGDLALMIAFDTWVRNPDRCPPPGHLIPEPNRDNVMFRSVGGWFELLAFDHTHCFTETDLETDLEGTYFVDDAQVYGAFPEFLPHIDEAGLRSACNIIAGIDEAQVMAIIGAVPYPWGPSQATRDRWVRQIINRAARVEEIVIPPLVNQGQLGL
jgi:hypothetical protein